MADARGEDDLLLAGGRAESAFDGELRFSVGDAAVNRQVFDFGGLRECEAWRDEECGEFEEFHNFE